MPAVERLDVLNLAAVYCRRAARPRMISKDANEVLTAEDTFDSILLEVVIMYFCTRCHRRVKRSRWGSWFEHLVSVVCDGQSAYWAEVD